MSLPLAALALLATGLLAAAPALAQNRFWLVNQSGLTIEHAYVSPSHLSDWGNDILGGTLVETGQQVRVTPASPDCALDIKVEYQGGGEEEKIEVNACRLNQVVFTNPRGQARRPDGVQVAGAAVPSCRPAVSLAAWHHPGPAPLPEGGAWPAIPVH
jgi:hypothetical protein